MLFVFGYIVDVYFTILFHSINARTFYAQFERSSFFKPYGLDEIHNEKSFIVVGAGAPKKNQSNQQLHNH